MADGEPLCVVVSLGEKHGATRMSGISRRYPHPSFFLSEPCIFQKFEAELSDKELNGFIIIFNDERDQRQNLLH